MATSSSHKNNNGYIDNYNNNKNWHEIATTSTGERKVGTTKKIENSTTRAGIVNITILNTEYNTKTAGTKTPTSVGTRTTIDNKQQQE